MTDKEFKDKLSSKTLEEAIEIKKKLLSKSLDDVTLERYSKICDEHIAKHISESKPGSMPASLGGLTIIPVIQGILKKIEDDEDYDLDEVAVDLGSLIASLSGSVPGAVSSPPTAKIKPMEEVKKKPVVLKGTKPYGGFTIDE